MKTKSPGNEDGHYSGEIQPVDYAEAQGWAPGAYQFSIIKYVTRYQKKAGILDLEKAKWFIEKLIKFEQNRADREKTKKD